VLAQLKNVSLSFPDKSVLDEESLTVYRGDRIALVGRNGSGKTSLFRILTKALQPDAGETSVARGTAVGHLEQDLAGLEGESRTCLEVALEPFEDLVRLEARIERIGAELAEQTDEAEVERLLAELGAAQQDLEAAGGYGFRVRAEAALTGLGLSESRWGRGVRTLSSGEKMRLALARLLLGGQDLLLLDEPTNHLDASAREWLEERLAGLRATYVVVSHDRRFLDKVAAKVAHLDRGKLTLYRGNYTAFRDQQRGQTEADWSRYEKGQKEVRKLQRQAQKYRGWSDRAEGEKRGAADKGFVSHKAAKLMKHSLIARRRLEEAAAQAKVDKPFEHKPVRIDFHHSKARDLLSTDGLAVGYEPGRPLARDLSLDLAAEERLAIRGPNGCGKTALLRTLLKEIPPLAGEVRLSTAAEVGYFDQEGRRLPRASTALEAVLSTGRDETLCRTVMGRMRVRRQTMSKPVGELSAGERAKVLLATLILGEHNLLALDEPTNHLDIETQDVLLDALIGFPGSILLVSHDRHFVETLATETLALLGEVSAGYTSYFT
jgi:ATP-binding cassette subfamily F protein 3